MKALFIPLKREYFEAFLRGDKTEEYRKHGPRWNEGTCFIGRAVVLSLGYGKANRRMGTISNFYITRGSALQGYQRIALRSCYGTIDIDVACIGIKLDSTE